MRYDWHGAWACSGNPAPDALPARALPLFHGGVQLRVFVRSPSGLGHAFLVMVVYGSADVIQSQGVIHVLSCYGLVCTVQVSLSSRYHLRVVLYSVCFPDGMGVRHAGACHHQIRCGFLSLPLGVCISIGKFGRWDSQARHLSFTHSSYSGDCCFSFGARPARTTSPVYVGMVFRRCWCRGHSLSRWCAWFGDGPRLVLLPRIRRWCCVI